MTLTQLLSLGEGRKEEGKKLAVRLNEVELADNLYSYALQTVKPDLVNFDPGRKVQSLMNVMLAITCHSSRKILTTK